MQRGPSAPARTRIERVLRCRPELLPRVSADVQATLAAEFDRLHAEELAELSPKELRSAYRDAHGTDPRGMEKAEIVRALVQFGPVMHCVVCHEAMLPAFERPRAPMREAVALACKHALCAVCKADPQLRACPLCREPIGGKRRRDDSASFDPFDVFSETVRAHRAQDPNACRPS